MDNPKQGYYDRRAGVLVQNLRSRHFDAWYCATREEALKKALELIPEGAAVGWGGAMSAKEIGLMDAVKQGPYRALDRDRCRTPQEKEQIMKDCMFCDVFLSGANAISMTGEMVNIDGNGNRVAAIVYGPKKVLVIAGMNKVADTLEDAVRRARTVAAPRNKQRFEVENTPCAVTGVCGNCHTEGCICNQLLITRNSRIPGRIQFVLVGEDLGL